MNPLLRPSAAVDVPDPVPVLTAAGFDQGVRWLLGERLEDLFEERCAQSPNELAVDAPGRRLTFAQLDAQANQLARHLLDSGIGSGGRVALLFDDPVQAYVGMLAVLKAGAAYIPLDPGFPADRIAYIVDDAEVGVVLSLSRLRDLAGDLDVPVVCVDAVPELTARDARPLTAAERGPLTDTLAYIIYTSGSTGRPKGVAVTHASICNFVRVAAEVYGIRPGDRMYQGMTIAFDFSVEETWVSWIAGATLVPKPAGASLLGIDLHEFLVARGVTAMCCVPTLLATLEEDVPDLRFLLVSGEACPHDLIVRWHRPGRRFLNVYGPTEATVTATWTVVDPDRAVTIGVPLPTYSIAILDPDDPGRALARGEVGEIGIAGIGLAVGYVNRDDLTAKAFVPDFLGIPYNPSNRIYRTGDLGRVLDDGEIEYLGRIDLQVKIRGYRIELTEIESVMLQVPGVAQAVVDTYEAAPGAAELVGYYSVRTDTEAFDEDRLLAHLREQLPPYMVPAYLERLAVVPMTTQNKADRKSLPAPTARRRGTQEHVAPIGPTETLLAELLAETLGLDRASAASHFFDDLGANSLLMAQFTARVRRHPHLGPVSIRDVYLNATITALAAAQPAAEPTTRPPTAPTVHRASTVSYVLCGSMQLLMFLASIYLGAVVLEFGSAWVAAGSGWIGVYGRSVAFAVAVFSGYCALPIVAKWTLVGRWTPTEIRAWSPAYLRFWTIKVLIRANPMALFVGSPLYLIYLRALGARIGRGAVILSRSIPVCTDLLTVGDGTFVREDSALPCYRAIGGRIETGRVTLGRNVFVGEKTVLDIGTAIGDDGQLGHCSSLQPGQQVPTGERWHGSPAQPTDVNYRLVTPVRCGALRRFGYSAVQLLNLFLLTPAVFALVVELATVAPWTGRLLDVGHSDLTSWSLYAELLAISLVLFYGGALAGLVFVFTVPRLLHRFVRPGQVHALYGWHYYLHRLIRRTTNVKFFTDLFGDSSYIVGYLKRLGYDLSTVHQTGSNFGTELKHDTPFLSVVGSGTMVSDALTIMNGEYSNTSFTVRRVVIGERNYLGNNLAYPAQARIGDNCLLATKAMIPIEGPVRHDVGLLGSPSFEIPRSVQRDSGNQLSEDDLRRGLAGKNRYNARTIGLFTMVRWFQAFCLLVITVVAADLYYLAGTWAVAATLLGMLLFRLGYSVLTERLAIRFRSLRPRMCSIYDPYFWSHERLWKLLASALFNGTPFKNVMWRMLGVDIGRRVLDLGCSIPEKTLVRIGDHATLNEGSVVQCHSLEDGVFKSDRSMIGAGCTLGVESFVHYGVRMGDGAVLAADAFLMKGEEVAPGAVWVGNPARETREPSPSPPLALSGRSRRSCWPH